MGTEETRKVVTDYYAALGRDRARIVELLGPDVAWVPPASAPIPPVTGGEAVADALGKDFVKATFDVSKPFQVEIRRMLADGDFAVVQQRIIGTAKATGKPYDNQYCWVYEVRDGRIVAMEEYADTLLAGWAFGWDLSER
jgi:uncharacterized protein